MISSRFLINFQRIVPQRPNGISWYFKIITSLQTYHVYSTLKQRVNDGFYVVSTWNARGVFVGLRMINVISIDH